MKIFFILVVIVNFDLTKQDGIISGLTNSGLGFGLNNQAGNSPSFGSGEGHHLDIHDRDSYLKPVISSVTDAYNKAKEDCMANLREGLRKARDSLFNSVTNYDFDNFELKEQYIAGYKSCLNDYIKKFEFNIIL